MAQTTAACAGDHHRLRNLLDEAHSVRSGCSGFYGADLRTSPLPPSCATTSDVHIREAQAMHQHQILALQEEIWQIESQQRLLKNQLAGTFSGRARAEAPTARQPLPKSGEWLGLMMTVVPQLPSAAARRRGLEILSAITKNMSELMAVKDVVSAVGGQATLSVLKLAADQMRVRLEDQQSGFVEELKTITADHPAVRAFAKERTRMRGGEIACGDQDPAYISQDFDLTGHRRPAYAGQPGTLPAPNLPPSAVNIGRFTQPSLALHEALCLARDQRGADTAAQNGMSGFTPDLVETLAQVLQGSAADGGQRQALPKSKKSDSDRKTKSTKSGSTSSDGQPTAGGSQPARQSRTRTKSSTAMSATLSASLNNLSATDQDCVFVVRRIKNLGYRAPRLLQKHYSAFGNVARVLLAHSTVRTPAADGEECHRRPSSMGFVQMSNAESVAQILGMGEFQTIDGVVIRVQKFVHGGSTRSTSNEGNDDGESPSQDSSE